MFQNVKKVGTKKVANEFGFHINHVKLLSFDRLFFSFSSNSLDYVLFVFRPSPYSTKLST